MISAKEALEKTKKAKGYNIEKSLAAIEKIIEEATSRGEYSAGVGCADIDEAIAIGNELIKLGYKISIARFIGPTLHIRW